MKDYKFPKFTYWFSILFLIVICPVNAQYITVNTTNNDADQILNNFLGINKGCISVSGAKITGWDQGGDFSYGYFDKDTSSFDIDKGIILSTGKAKAAEGPKGRIQSFTGSGWKGDDDLSDEIRGGTVDATALEFDFISYSSDQISFEYMFLSEEYYPGNCRFSDGLAFFIKKTGSLDPYENFARIPGTNRPVTVPNVNSSCPSGDPTYFGGFVGFDDAANSPTNFNGQTKIMTATAKVQIGVTYHIKIVIADEGNYQYDSAVLLKAGSFVGNKNLGPDLSLENGTALCISGNYTVDATPDPVLQGNSKDYTWYKDGNQILTGDFPKYIVDYNAPGFYEVEIILDSGCKLKGGIKVEQQILPVIGSTIFNGICDDDLDGSAEVYFNSYTQQIISNLSQDYSFNIKYFENPPVNINNPDFTKAINSIKFTSNSKDVYIWVKPGQCTPTLMKITFNRNLLSTFDSSVSLIPFDICDNELKGEVEIDMTSADYIKALIPAGYNGQLSFYLSEKGAKEQKAAEFIPDPKHKKINEKDPKPTYFIRFHQTGLCDNVAPIKFNFKQPKKSIILKDSMVCKGVEINMDAGLGFDSYRWYKESDPAKATISTLHDVQQLSAGDYIVELGFNGCVYPQPVKISEAVDPVIDNVLIEENNITVLVSAGNAPYLYALDNGNYQNSNIFTNLDFGNHIVYVKGTDGCAVILKNFTLIKTQNVITPNNDGINDFIDYSSLLTKIDPRFEVYDRNGIMVFKGDSNNRFIWNGMSNGRTLATASYWYVLEWNESGNPKRLQNTGWILLKNRN